VRLLGVVLAGGQSRRFGSDKALALLDGRPLIDHALAALSGCEAVVVAGREWPGVHALPDRPGPDMGPLGGLNAALHHATDQGFTHVASVPVDCPGLPGNWLAQLDDGPAHDMGQPLIGMWPVALAAGLAAFLGSGQRRVQHWVAGTGARAIDLGPLANVNRAEDLAVTASAVGGNMDSQKGNP
jgi:molybdopterin-guanine dinucleotide biosynthesis protein A